MSQFDSRKWIQLLLLHEGMLVHHRFKLPTPFPQSISSGFPGWSRYLSYTPEWREVFHHSTLHTDQAKTRIQTSRPKASRVNHQAPLPVSFSLTGVKNYWIVWHICGCWRGYCTAHCHTSYTVAILTSTVTQSNLRRTRILQTTC